MNTSIGFSDRNTLNTMGTTLVFHAVIRTLPFNNKGNIFNAALTSLIDIQDFNLPALALGITAVHAEEFTREKRSLISASTTLNGDDGIFLIHNIFRQERDFDFLEQVFFIRFQALDFFKSQFTHLGVVAFIHFLGFSNLFVVLNELVILIHDLFEFSMLTTIALEEGNVFKYFWLGHQ